MSLSTKTKAIKKYVEGKEEKNLSDTEKDFLSSNRKQRRRMAKKVRLK